MNEAYITKLAPAATAIWTANENTVLLVIPLKLRMVMRAYALAKFCAHHAMT